VNSSLTRRITLHTPGNFNFWRTVYSHGWCALPPFRHNADSHQLERLLSLEDTTLVHCTLADNGTSVSVVARSASPLTRDHRQELIRQLRTCLRLEEDFTPFHREATKHEEFRWVARTKGGRLLASPSVFEDLVKMMCTTNCTWGLTTLMVTNLVRHFGKKFDNTLYAFPSPDAIAGATERYLRTHIKSGYRSPHLLELAERVAGGKLDPESWRTSSLPTQELFEQVQSVKGIGPYAAGNLLKLIGRYDYLGLDSWVRSKYCELHARRRPVKDSAIEKHYKRFGQWRGLFFWLEMTRDWHQDKFKI
jgi:3-methyladenine DNA glycosylase/8-oxoguanine DNA glycosylase